LLPEFDHELEAIVLEVEIPLPLVQNNLATVVKPRSFFNIK
jgi:hypothetical protein